MEGLAVAVGVIGGLLGAGIVALVAVAAGRAISRRAAARERWAEDAALAALMAEWGPDDRAEIDEATRLTRTLAECSVIWGAVGDPVRTTVRAAAEALALGLDTPALRVLAGLSERSTDEAEVRRLLDETLAELGVATIDRESVEARLLVLRRFAADWLARGSRDWDPWIVSSDLGEEAYDERWWPLFRAWIELDVRLEWQPDEARRDAPAVIATFLDRTAGLKPTR